MQLRIILQEKKDVFRTFLDVEKYMLDIIFREWNMFSGEIYCYCISRIQFLLREIKVYLNCIRSYSCKHTKQL